MRRLAFLRSWWLSLAGIWALATIGDRLWLRADGRVPSWDQADYLNSAVDHGRALGLLPAGGWSSWADLLDLSPKIPPLASLVNGSVMAVAGDGVDEASWALALWHGLLLVVVALWGRQLQGRGFGLLAAALVALLPALAGLRVDYTLDIPLTATTTLALWRLGCWQAPAPRGGRWVQALTAALAVAASLLVKQSALLVVALPCLWAAGQGLGRRGRRLQVLAALVLVLALLAPWLRHNGITTLGGTNRAVVESAAAEGDPTGLALEALLWYPRLWPQQIGIALLGPALAAGLLALWQARRGGLRALVRAMRSLPAGWPWLIGCTLAGLIATTLSPNKDARYIAPVLPLLTLLLARGWWWIGQQLARRWGSLVAGGALAAGLMSATAGATQDRLAALEHPDPSPIPAVIDRLRRAEGDRPVTLAMVPGTGDLNEQNVTYFGRLGGGRIVGRRVGRNPREHDQILRRSSWILLASGDQGTRRASHRQLSQRVRADGRFEPVGTWPWTDGRSVELWRRRGGMGDQAGPAEPFDADFIRLARGMEQGPRGIAAIFRHIGPEHLLDGHFLYQRRVRDWAMERLSRNPNDPDALWSLALIEVLRNRPAEAEVWFGRLAANSPSDPWPASYRAVVLLIDGQPVRARQALETLPESARRDPVVKALGDLARVLGGRLDGLPAARASVEAAIADVKAALKAQD
ncbi:phospholipid carrier-dependent glycosyltransferase [Cyanobium sp. FGCU-52]|nr:phospholipid carrier-dependent glycosyltransferase [Cyanobium sp. FGCU52]